MNQTSTTRILALALGLILFASACGSEVGIAAEAPVQPPTDPAPSDSSGDSDEPSDEPNKEPSEEPSEDSLPNTVPLAGVDGDLIGSANMGGQIVDPKPTAISDIAILESYPEQLAIEFTAGAEPCLAATAEAVTTDDQVVVTLQTGITTDALAKSCRAGEFVHTLIIALDEGLDGRQVVAADVGEPDEPASEPVAQEFEQTLVGLSEAKAQEAVDDRGLIWRVVGRDGEAFAITMDYSTDRINVSITDGVVTESYIG